MKVHLPAANRDEFLEWLQECHGLIFLFSPYIQQSAIAMIIAAISEPSRKVNLLVRADPLDIMNGATSIEALEMAHAHKWSLRYNSSLHAKAFWQDNGRIFFGSANLTGRGIAGHISSNYEVTGRTDNCDIHTIHSLQNLWNNSHPISAADITLLKQFKTKSKFTPPDVTDFPLKKTDSINRKFSLLDIPQSQSLKVFYKKMQSKDRRKDWDQTFLHDLELLQVPLTATQQEIHAAFRHLPLTAELLREIGEGKFFGHLRRWLAANIDDTPTPSRESLNEQLNRLYDLVVEASDGGYEKIRPNHSEGIFKTIKKAPLNKLKKIKSN
jgi:hypothetical protein